MAHWYRRVFLLAVPLILTNLTQPLLSTVDTVLSGHLPGAAALGGVAVGGIFFNAVFWTFGFLRMGTTGLVAQAYGARDAHTLRLHFLRALLSAMAIGALILLVRGPLVSIAVNLLGAGGAVRENALVYCRIRIWSAPAALASYVILGSLLGKQRARTALALQAAINIVNVAVALALVIKLHWGVAGIATATLCADWVGCGLGLALLGWTARTGCEQHGALVRLSSDSGSPSHPFRTNRGKDGAPSWRELADGPSLRALFALNRDIFLRTLGLVAAYAWFTRTGARAGDATLAANAVLLNLHMLASYGLDGFANATEALVGEAIGARRKKDYHAILRASGISAFIVAALISLAYLAFGARIVGLYSNQESVRLLALHYLPWAVAMPVIAVAGFQLDGVFIGATRARELRDSMLISFAGYWLLALALTPRFGNNGLWCAFMCFMILRGGNLALRLPRIEKSFAEPVPVS
jgi:MATE family multidrug resistance protein